MSKRHIHDRSWGYELIRQMVLFLYPKFFREMEIRGLENIPDNEPLIFAGNHQNGVMDPLAIILYQKEPIVYMGRADIFSNPLNKLLLRFIKVTPVYRIRDGFENLSKNDQQIKEAIDVLLNRKRLGVMPEGNHGENHRLRPLVKGLFRIGYQAELMLDNRAHVKIIPVGIDYSFYQHAGTDLVLTYGKPIEIKDFLPIYLENPANGLNVLRSELAKAISGLMLDIRSRNYERTHRLCCYGVPAFLEHQAEKGQPLQAKTMAGLRFDARVALAERFDRLESEDEAMLQKMDELTLRLNQLPGFPTEIMEWMEEKTSKINWVILGIISLLLIPGFLLNFPSWALNRWIVSRVEDKQMHSTFVFTLGMAFNLIVYLLVTLIVGNQMEYSTLQTLFLFLTIGLLGIVSEKCRQLLRIPFRKVWYSFGARNAFLKACKEDYSRLKALIKAFLEEK